MIDYAKTKGGMDTILYAYKLTVRRQKFKGTTFAQSGHGPIFSYTCLLFVFEIVSPINHGH